MFVVTYEVITHESAAQGDVAEHGFIDCDGYRTDKPVVMRLRDAVKYVSPQEYTPHRFYEVDGVIDYRTGSCEHRSLHVPETITNASLNRLKRLFYKMGHYLGTDWD